MKTNALKNLKTDAVMMAVGMMFTACSDHGHGKTLNPAATPAPNATSTPSPANAGPAKANAEGASRETGVGSGPASHPTLEDGTNSNKRLPEPDGGAGTGGAAPDSAAGGSGSVGTEK